MDHLRRLPGGAVHPPDPRTPVRFAIVVREAEAPRLTERRSAMRREDDRRSAPRWRAILEARWRIRLQELTELSMAYHGAASDDTDDRRARRLLHRAVAARQRLADTEDALGRVTAGVFGRCEQCGALIPEVLLAAAPESRYCARCTGAATGPLTTGPLTTGAGTANAGTAGAGAGRR
jgi:RNA polymerase-binding transcription factor DksA